MEGGHDVAIPKIISRYNRSIVNYRIASQIVDRTYNNSVENAEAQLLFRMVNGKWFKIYVDDIPKWVQTIL